MDVNIIEGNGHLKHRSKTFVDWKPENWVKSLGMDNHFTIQDGKVTIKESGLYFVYAQVSITKIYFFLLYISSVYIFLYFFEEQENYLKFNFSKSIL